MAERRLRDVFCDQEMPIVRPATLTVDDGSLTMEIYTLRALWIYRDRCQSNLRVVFEAGRC